MTTQQDRCPNCQAQWMETYPRNGGREQCGGCGALRNTPQALEQGNPRERSIAAMMELHFTGVYYRGMLNHFRTLGEECPKAWNITKWADQCIQVSAGSDREKRINGGEEWDIIMVKTRESKKEYFHFVVLDRKTQYILSTQVSERPSIIEQTVQQALRRSGNTPKRIASNVDNPSLDNALESAINTPLEIRRDNLQKITAGSRLQAYLETIKARAADTSGHRSRDTLQNYAEGLALDLNNFRALSPQDLRTPAEAAGARPRYRDWLTVARESPIPTGDPEPHPSGCTARGGSPQIPSGWEEQGTPGSQGQEESMQNTTTTTLLAGVEEYLGRAQARHQAMEQEFRQLNDEIEAATLLASVLRQRQEMEEQQDR